MTALCQARVSSEVPSCNAPASPASDPGVPLCEKHLAIRDEINKAWGNKRKGYVPTAAEIAAVLNDGGRRT